MATIEDLDKYPDNWHLEEFYNMGYSKGLSEGEAYGSYMSSFMAYCIGFFKGELSMALKFKEALGIDEAVRISGFSRNLLESYSNKE